MREFLANLIANRGILVTLARRDLTAAYSGSVAGNLWVILDPLVYVLLTLLFFQFAIKGGDTGGVPYVAWVLPIVVFWTFVNGALSAMVGSVREYGYLLRHRSFDLRLVAVVKLLSGGFVHVMLMAVVLMALAAFVGVHPTWKLLQLPYYLLSMMAVLLCMGWLVSALGTFWKDMRNLVSIFLQLEFWVSPVFWEPERFPKPVALIMYINPFYYPLHGYRQAILGGDFGPHFLVMTVYFWALVAGLAWLASRTFRRLQRSFGDVL